MSIESEICLVTQSESVHESLFRMGILSSIDEHFSPVSQEQIRAVLLLVVGYCPPVQNVARFVDSFLI
jgi:hypothetical protein